MYDLPTTIIIDDKEFNIRNNGDYRMVLDCFDILNSVDLNKQERLLSCLIIFYDNMYDINDLTELGDLNKATLQMFNFFNCGQPENMKKSDIRLIDWDKDSQMIVSGVNNVAKLEVRSVEYMHWWTFMGYFNSIGESTLSTVVSIRHKIATNKKLEKYEQEFKRDNPQYFMIRLHNIDDEALEFERELQALWNNS